MWYVTDEENKIHFDKPIAARNSHGDVCLLLPQILPNDYTIVGYNWFNVTLGEWNSCATFKTSEKAVNAYSSSWDIYNTIVALEKEIPK